VSGGVGLITTHVVELLAESGWGIVGLMFVLGEDVEVFFGLGVRFGFFCKVLRDERLVVGILGILPVVLLFVLE
jgi:hypothetical protein